MLIKHELSIAGAHDYYCASSQQRSFTGVLVQRFLADGCKYCSLVIKHLQNYESYTFTLKL